MNTNFRKFMFYSKKKKAFEYLLKVFKYHVDTNAFDLIKQRKFLCELSQIQYHNQAKNDGADFLKETIALSMEEKEKISSWEGRTIYSGITMWENTNEK